jgi:hypothetical protein
LLLLPAATLLSAHTSEAAPSTHASETRPTTSAKAATEEHVNELLRVYLLSVETATHATERIPSSEALLLRAGIVTVHARLVVHTSLLWIRQAVVCSPYDLESWLG